MADDLQVLRADLDQLVGGALKRQALSNKGTLSPSRLAGLAREIVEKFLASAGDERGDRDYAFGETLGQQGLSLASLLEAETAVVEAIADARAAARVDMPIGIVPRFFGQLVQGLVAGATADMEHQRAEMERAYMATVSEQREQQELLRTTISELSTPIIPVHEGILVLPLVGSLDSRRATEITERLLESIALHQAELVIMDITGVPLIDTSTANHLLMTTRAAGLLGSRVVLVGMGPDIAQTIVHLGVELQGLTTLANLQAGITYALGRIGLGIQPLRGRLYQAG
jgi:anti-anti-sigma regulatory factor